MDARTPQIIIFTGHDCSGKTTIAQELSRSLHIPYFQNKLTKAYLKEGRETLIQAMRFDQNYILQFLEQTGYSAIFDRAYESEWVYSQVMGYKTDEKLVWELDKQFADLGTSIIVCYKDLSNYHDDTFSVELGGEKAMGLYFEFFKLTKCNTMLLDTSDEDLDRQTVEVTRWLNCGKLQSS